MDKRAVAFIIFSAGIGLGYKIGEYKSDKDYEKWQREHTFRCWRPEKNPAKPGDYPSVFVIETITTEAN